MRVPAALALASIFTLLAPGASLAMSDNMQMGGSMKMAKCPAGDPAVIMNTTKMTYMMDTQKNRDAMKGMMGHDKFVCKSQAEKMHAKMVSGPPSMKKGM